MSALAGSQPVSVGERVEAAGEPGAALDPAGAEDKTHPHAGRLSGATAPGHRLAAVRLPRVGYLIRGEPAPGRPEGAIEPDPSLPRACVIGAGSCGVAAAKALYEGRIPFDCFEAGPLIGGLWKIENPNGLSGAYTTLEMNTSGPRMSFSDFPIGYRRLPAARATSQLLRPLRRPLRVPREDHLQHQGRARAAARRGAGSR